MGKAAQGFSLRRTFEYAAGGNLRRTQRIGKMAISGWKLSKFSNRNQIQHRLFFTINAQQFVDVIIEQGTDRARA